MIPFFTDPFVFDDNRSAKIFFLHEFLGKDRHASIPISTWVEHFIDWFSCSCWQKGHLPLSCSVLLTAEINVFERCNRLRLIIVYCSRWNIEPEHRNTWSTSPFCDPNFHVRSSVGEFSQRWRCQRRGSRHAAEKYDVRLARWTDAGWCWSSSVIETRFTWPTEWSPTIGSLRDSDGSFPTCSRTTAPRAIPDTRWCCRTDSTIEEYTCPHGRRHIRQLWK